MHETEVGTVDEDWDVLLSFLPRDWRELAQDTEALKGLHKDKIRCRHILGTATSTSGRSTQQQIGDRALLELGMVGSGILT